MLINLKLLLPYRDALCVEFFDFVLGGCRSGGGGGNFDFHQGFGEGFGINVTCFVQGLGVSEDGEEVTAGGGSGEEWGKAEFV